MHDKTYAWVVLLLGCIACGNTRNTGPEGESQPNNAGTSAQQAPQGAAQVQTSKSDGLPWLSDEKQALAMSREQDKPIFADFRADWCAPCIEMEKTTFADPQVADHLRKNYVLWRADVTDSNDENDSLMFRYKAKTLPMLVVIDKSGTVSTRISEFVDAPELLRRLGR